MKRIAALMLILAMLFALAACEKAPAASDTNASQNSAQEDDNAAPSGQGDEEKVVVWFATMDNLGDHAYADDTWEGLQALAEKYPVLDIHILELGSTNQSQYEPQILEVLDSGCDIFTCSANYSMADIANKYANDYPDTTFWFVDLSADYTFNNPKNSAGMMFKQNEVMFLAGALAASMDDTGILGFLGGMESTVICDFGAGFIDGATYINPDIKIIFSFVGNFDDAAKAKELARVQYDLGASMTHNVFGPNGYGIFEMAAEYGRYAYGVDNDQRATMLLQGEQELADTIITSSTKKWANSVCFFIEQYLTDYDSIRWGEIIPMGLAENGVGLCKNDYYLENVPQEYQDLINELEQKIIDGEIVPKTAMDMTMDEWLAYKATVNIATE